MWHIEKWCMWILRLLSKQGQNQPDLIDILSIPFLVMILEMKSNFKFIGILWLKEHLNNCLYFWCNPILNQSLFEKCLSFYLHFEWNSHTVPFFLIWFHLKWLFRLLCLVSKLWFLPPVRGQENGLDGGKAGVAGRGAERGRRGRGRGRGTVGEGLQSFSLGLIGLRKYDESKHERVDLYWNHSFYLFLWLSI